MIKAIADQAAKLAFTYSGVFTHPVAEKLAARLIQDSKGAFDKVLFLSGDLSRNLYSLFRFFC